MVVGWGWWWRGGSGVSKRPKWPMAVGVATETLAFSFAVLNPYYKRTRHKKPSHRHDLSIINLYGLPPVPVLGLVVHGISQYIHFVRNTMPTTCVCARAPIFRIFRLFLVCSLPRFLSTSSSMANGIK